MLESEFTLLNDFPPTTYEAWRAAVEQDLKGAPFEKKVVTTTYEGLEIQPVHTAREWPTESGPSGWSGTTPFTRGSRWLANHESGWRVVQQRREPSLALASAAIAEDLSRGAQGIVLCLDAASRAGLDPDDARAKGLVGKSGLAAYNAQDLRSVLSHASHPQALVVLEAGAAFFGAAAELIAALDPTGTGSSKLTGSFGADPLGVLASEGSLPAPLATLLAQVADLARWTDAHAPGMTAIRVGSEPYHHAGASETLDLAISMATGVEYLRALTGAGLSVDKAAGQLLFGYAVGTDFFAAIAKLRAARKLWARIVEVAGGSAGARGLKSHVTISQRVLTRRDPWVNILRNTVACFAAGVAGADLVTSIPFDDSVGLPGPLARRLARNTQVILQEESHLHRVADPAGGCWYLESLTDRLATKAWTLFQDIETRGGLAKALSDGWIGEQIEATHRARAKNVATRRDPITGVSEFPNLQEQHLEAPAVDLAAVAASATATVVAARQSGATASLLARLTNGVGSLELAIEAARAGATTGQLSARLLVGETAKVARALEARGNAQPFERLRDASDAWLARTGARPRVFLANMGPLAHHTARAGYTRNLFEAGGFEVLSNEGFRTAEDAARALTSSGAGIAVICSSDKLYEQLVAELAPALHKAGARTVVLAGNPGDKEQAYRAAGVDRFIFIRCNVLSTLSELLAEEGVL